MDALNSIYSTTYEIDLKHGTDYHKKFKEFVKMVQSENLVIGGAMTDVKGDRSLTPSQQEDPDMFVHVTKRDNSGVYISGAKAASNWMYKFALDYSYAHHAFEGRGQKLCLSGSRSG